MDQKYSSRLVLDCPDRRKEPRIEIRFPVRIRGAGPDGGLFEVQTSTDDISTSGVHVAINPLLTLGTAVTVIVHFSQSGMRVEELDGVVAQGEVVRTELAADGRYNVAIRFLSYFSLNPG